MAGGLVEETYPSGRLVRNVLDGNGDLAMVESKKNAAAGFWRYAGAISYNAAGAVASLQLGNGHWESTTFNSRLQPTQIALGTLPGQAGLLSLQYTYESQGNHDNNGNILSQTITVPNSAGHTDGFTAAQAYTYDELNRLKSASETIGGNQSWKQTFEYDRYGNRRFDANNTTTIPQNCSTAVCNPGINSGNDNRFNSGQGYSYDANGAVTQNAANERFGYDAESRQKEFFAANNGGSTPNVTYHYDGEGRRVKKVTSSETVIFVYDAGGQLTAEYSTLDPNQIESGSAPAVAYLTNDNLGTPRINTDASGAVTARHDYMPYGEEIIAFGTRSTPDGYTADTIRKQFTGYEADTESSLDFAQARMYSRALARFTSSDPLLSSGRSRIPQSWNRYIFVLNNPLKYSDPLGLFEFVDGTSEKDKKRITKAYDKLVEARNRYKEGSKKYNEINKAISTLGKPGEANGVFVLVDNTQSNPGKCICGPATGDDGKMTGKADIYIGLNLSKFEDNNLGNAELAQAFGHEGRHAADFQSESAPLAGMTIQQFNDYQAQGKVMSRAISEVNAYRVSSYIAEAVFPSNALSSSFNDSEVWNRSWKATDQDANRDKGIVGVLESPKGSYKFKFTPNPKSANNPIDDPALWSNNGGPIF